MTGNTRKNSSKGMAIIGWVLMIGFTVATAAIVINWAQQNTKSQTESTVRYIEGRMDCQSIRMTNISTDCINHNVELKNTGALNIIKVSAQIDDKKSLMIDIDLKAQGAAQTLNIPENFKELKLIPILKSGEDLTGCKEKSITVHC